jgi:hypothetical protein
VHRTTLPAKDVDGRAKPEQDKPEQDKPEQDKPEQDKPEQDKPEQDRPGHTRPYIEHDPEKWEPVFGKDHAQTKG